MNAPTNPPTLAGINAAAAFGLVVVLVLGLAEVPDVEPEVVALAAEPDLVPDPVLEGLAVNVDVTTFRSEEEEEVPEEEPAEPVPDEEAPDEVAVAACEERGGLLISVKVAFRSSDDDDLEEDPSGEDEDGVEVGWALA